jgi:hypothetical protein
MKRKLFVMIAIITGLVLVFNFTACNRGGSSNSSSNETTGSGITFRDGKPYDEFMVAVLPNDSSTTASLMALAIAFDFVAVGGTGSSDKSNTVLVGTPTGVWTGSGTYMVAVMNMDGDISYRKNVSFKDGKATIRNRDLKTVPNPLKK